MIYLNNFIPVRVYHSSELDRYRLEAPLADQDTIQWNEDFLANKLPRSYRLEKTIWVLNPRIFPPVPLSTSMFIVYQNDIPPYNTLHLAWIAFPIMTNVMTTLGNFCFISFTTSLHNTLPMFVCNEDVSCRITLDQDMIAHYFRTTPFQDKALNRDNFVLYVFSRPYLFWKGTTECLCTPSDDPRDFAMLVDCQRMVYPQIRNKTSYTGNSAVPLSRIRDQLFPQDKARFTIPILCLVTSCALVVAVCVWIYRQKSAGHQDAPGKPVVAAPNNPGLHVPLANPPAQKLLGR